MQKYGDFEIAMLSWKQLKFKKFISFQNLEYVKRTVAKFHLYTFHKQEIINKSMLKWNLQYFV